MSLAESTDLFNVKSLPCEKNQSTARSHCTQMLSSHLLRMLSSQMLSSHRISCCDEELLKTNFFKDKEKVKDNILSLCPKMSNLYPNTESTGS